MKHKTTYALFDYWNVMRAGRPAPLRSEIQPGFIKRILPYVFILERQNDESFRFRLAGTGLCNVYGMEFRNHNLLSMWKEDCHTNLKLALQQVIEDASVAIVEYTATTVDQREATFEMVLLPLAQDNGAITRVLGAAVPIDEKHWIGDYLFAHQWIDRLQIVDPERVPPRKRVAEPARRIMREKPSVPTTNIASLVHRRPPLKSERSYLRLVKTQAHNGEH